jgi:membrane protease YdiL (CAAX protease family)
MISMDRAKILVTMSPAFVLLFTKSVILLSITYLPRELSWIPGFVGYYLSISLVILISKRYLSLPFEQLFSASFRPVPKTRLLLLTIVIPALLPISAFITQIGKVPFEFVVYIIIFSCINPIFEEAYWRGFLTFLPGSNLFRITYSAMLFSFSHFFLWNYWFQSPIILIPTLVSTFLMGVAWMLFMQKQRNLVYPILSHFFVDVFNLSVAVYYGIVSFDQF